MSNSKFKQNRYGAKSGTGRPVKQSLSANGKGQTERAKRILPHTLKSTFRIRQDVKTWNRGQDQARSAERPVNWPLIQIFEEVLTDAHLYSQKQNRDEPIYSAKFSLKNSAGEVDDDATAIIKNLLCYRTLTEAMLEKKYQRYSLVELDVIKTDSGFNVTAEILPRTNVVPQAGLFYKDYTDDLSAVRYREMAEFGTSILEFYDPNTLGLLNKAVSHVLFKRFAQSCWSELCEIYGIPPRVMKTDTQDPDSLNRADKMMRDQGAAAYFIIDSTEEFEWAQAVNTNGDVYKNLIKLCSDEISLLMTGVVMGQDSKHGSQSKEKTSQEILWERVQSDMQEVQSGWNNIIIPALVKLGILKAGYRFEFDPSEDLAELWKRTMDALKFYTVDAEWVKQKFGVEITGERITVSESNSAGELTAGFFG